MTKKESYFHQFEQEAHFTMGLNEVRIEPHSYFADRLVLTFKANCWASVQM